LVARLNGVQEVAGSNPAGPTNGSRGNPQTSRPFPSAPSRSLLRPNTLFLAPARLRGRRVLHLRDAKTGDRDVWLAEPALTVLRELPRIEGSPFVFPSRRKAREPRPVGEFRKPWKALLKVANIAHTDPYVLRHTLASEAEALGFSLYLTGELLGHSVRTRDMTRGYVHHVPDDVRRASERVAASIAVALTGESPSNIVPLASVRA